MQSLKDDPKAEKYKGILIGMPTFGMVSINFMISQLTAGTPIFTSKSYMPVIGKPIDVARNEIAAQALASNHSYVWFRDDDVSVPQNAAVKLMGRLSSKQRANPREVGDMIVGGVVYSKMKPPQPMIYREKVTGGYEDWNYGDLVEADAIGMGCTLIPTGVFKTILDNGLNEFQCVNETCTVNWTVTHPKGVERCPTCGGPLVPIFFKTVRAGQGLGDQPVELTEDTYFCFLAKDNGAKIYADCGVQCQHECTDTGTMFYFHEGMGIPCWECDGKIEFYPQIRDVEPEEKKPTKANGKAKKVKFNLGSGGVNIDGYVNIDISPLTKPDMLCDARDLRPVIAKYGLADEIIASHLLEHVNKSAVTATVRNWFKALKPGGRLFIEVPDARVAMQEFLDKDAEGGKWADIDWKEAVVFGAQRYVGDEHQTAITENKMKRVLRSLHNQIERYTMESLWPKECNQQVIRIEAYKKNGKPKPKKGRAKEKK